MLCNTALNIHMKRAPLSIVSTTVTFCFVYMQVGNHFNFLIKSKRLLAFTGNRVCLQNKKIPLMPVVCCFLMWLLFGFVFIVILLLLIKKEKESKVNKLKWKLFYGYYNL